MAPVASYSLGAPRLLGDITQRLAGRDDDNDFGGREVGNSDRELAIVGGVLGGLVGLFFLVAIILKCWRRWKFPGAGGAS